MAAELPYLGKIVRYNVSAGVFQPAMIVGVTAASTIDIVSYSNAAATFRTGIVYDETNAVGKASPLVYSAWPVC